ncbi:actin-like protein ARP8 [Panicum miliaceum]|uniref:Actin-like protein ARP8 n=1 Tax=Panicum miliaceum TaxID=4540 RepID=A0A3L6QW83_PANMI|nr:actin-like protein ARP8 [Panicum miliaceum]
MWRLLVRVLHPLFLVLHATVEMDPWSRVLRNIFCMCKSMVHEVNENRYDIIEMKSEMGLLSDTHHELLELDDPFAEWDAQDAQAAQGEE